VVVLAPERIDVEGSIATDDDPQPARREIIVVDASGARRDAVTDEHGRFTIHGVVPPYDLAPIPLPGSAPVMYLGLRRRDPSVAVFERDGRGPRSTRVLRARIDLGRSPCAAGTGWVTLLTSSTFGSGSGLSECRGGEKAVDLTVEHASSSAADTTEEVDVHALVENEDASSVAYAHLSNVRAVAGAVTAAGNLEPSPVRFTAPITIAVGGDSSSLPDWHWTTTLSLDLPGGAGRGATNLFVSTADTSPARLSVPRIPGATVRASVFGVHPRGDGQDGFFRSSEAWSGALVDSSSSLALPVLSGPDFVRPREHEALSRSDISFEWRSPSSNTSALVSLVNPSHGTIALRILTDERSITYDRLRALGIVELEVGEHWLELSGFPGTAIDDLASPDRATRERPYDRSRPGTTTLLRIPISVVD
jgi:hypothetical protein